MADLPTVTPSSQVLDVTPLAELAADAAAMIEGAIPANTRRAYGGAWGRWRAWATAEGLDALPASPPAVALYLQSLVNAGRRMSSIEQAASAIAAEHRRAGLDSPTLAPVVRLLLHAARVRIGVAPLRSKAALSVRQLAALVDALPAGARGTRDRAILLLGFSGALRRSELVAIDVGDIEAREEGIVIRLRHSKGDNEGRGDAVPVPRAARPALCPVAALAAWRALLPADATGPIFRPVFGADTIGRGRLCDRTVARIVQDAAAAAGLDAASFGGHSLRIGFVTACAGLGIEERAIMRHTRHRSIGVMRGYIRDGGMFLDNPAARLL